MSLNQHVEFVFDQTGRRYPVLRLTADGVHDVGRIIATLARGNCEHASLAYEVGRELNRTVDGRATLHYLERQGGPKLGPAPCEECEAGHHSECYQLHHPYDPIDGAVCGCYEAREVRHTFGCCIDDCTERPTVRLESYPDNVFLCHEHRMAHGPLEEWEVMVELPISGEGMRA